MQSPTSTPADVATRSPALSISFCTVHLLPTFLHYSPKHLQDARLQAVKRAAHHRQGILTFCLLTYKMGDPPTPARDRFGGSRRPSNYHPCLGPIPPLSSFTGTLDEQIRKVKEWREEHQQQQQQPPAITPAQHTRSRNALATNASPANDSRSASWSTSSPNNAPLRNAQSFHQQQPQRPSQNPSHNPYPANVPPPYLFYPGNRHYSSSPAAPAVVGSTPAVTNTLRPNPVQSSPFSHHHAEPYGQPRTNHYQFNTQSIAPGYQQPFAPSPSPSYLDQPPQARSTQQYGYADIHEFVADRPDLADAHQLRRNAPGTGTLLPADTQQAVYRQHRPEPHLHSQLPTLHKNLGTAPPSDSPTTTGPPEFACSSEDEDWKAFEAEVISNTPTAASAAAVARNTAVKSGTRRAESRLSLESSSARAPARDAARPTTPELPQGSPFEPSPVEIGSHKAVRPAVPEAASGPSAQPDLVDKPAEDAAQPSESLLRPRAKHWSKALERNINLEPSLEGFPLGTIGVLKNKDTNLDAENERVGTRDIEVQDTEVQDGEDDMNQDSTLLPMSLHYASRSLADSVLLQRANERPVRTLSLLPPPSALSMPSQRLPNPSPPCPSFPFLRRYACLLPASVLVLKGPLTNLASAACCH